VLTDPKEIEIISRAQQKNVRDPKRSREHFVHIFEDFLAGARLDGRYLDIGPGQFDLGELLRQNGGSCVGIDRDPAVIELGQYKGFETVEINIQKLPKHDFGERFDGVFNKFSLNAFWHWSKPEKQRELIVAIDALIAPDGWSWIGPWNGVPKNADLDETTIVNTLDLQKNLFEERGFETVDLSLEQSRYYGIHGAIANNVVFIKNLAWRPGTDTPQ